MRKNIHTLYCIIYSIYKKNYNYNAYNFFYNDLNSFKTVYISQEFAFDNKSA